jgi:hypothetical protein
MMATLLACSMATPTAWSTLHAISKRGSGRGRRGLNRSRHDEPVDIEELLYKDYATTALIGLVFFGSCLVARKPLVFYFAQRYGTDGTHEGMSTFDRMWDTSHEFRRSMYFISYLWATLFLIQAAVTALIVRETHTAAHTTTTRPCPMSPSSLASWDQW